MDKCCMCGRTLEPLEIEFYENTCEDCEERACLGLAAEMREEPQAGDSTNTGETA